SFFFQAEDGIRDGHVTGVQTCALPIYTGFLGGPAVLANMAADSWVPHQYRYLSTRLVTQKGIQLMGFAAFGILIVTGGRVALLEIGRASCRERGQEAAGARRS